MTKLIYVVVNKETDEEKDYETVGEMRKAFCRLAEMGVNATFYRSQVLPKTF